jgi:hypothetical protein
MRMVHDTGATPGNFASVELELSTGNFASADVEFDTGSFGTTS